MILLKLANTIVDPSRLNSATSCSRKRERFRIQKKFLQTTSRSLLSKDLTCMKSFFIIRWTIRQSAGSCSKDEGEDSHLHRTIHELDKEKTGRQSNRTRYRALKICSVKKPKPSCTPMDLIEIIELDEGIFISSYRIQCHSSGTIYNWVDSMRMTHIITHSFPAELYYNGKKGIEENIVRLPRLLGYF